MAHLVERQVGEIRRRLAVPQDDPEHHVLLNILTSHLPDSNPSGNSRESLYAALATIADRFEQNSNQQQESKQDERHGSLLASLLGSQASLLNSASPDGLLRSVFGLSTGIDSGARQNASRLLGGFLPEGDLLQADRQLGGQPAWPGLGSAFVSSREEGDTDTLRIVGGSKVEDKNRWARRKNS
eukprot:1151356-Pelagomonas_calceolata.AAC.4